MRHRLALCLYCYYLTANICWSVHLFCCWLASVCMKEVVVYFASCVLRLFWLWMFLLGFILLLSRCSWRWRKHVTPWLKMIISYYHHLSAEAALFFFLVLRGMWWWINCRPSLSSAYFVLCADWQFCILIPCTYGSSERTLNLWFVIPYPNYMRMCFRPVMITMSCTNLRVSVLRISTTIINLRPCHSSRLRPFWCEILGLMWINIVRFLVTNRALILCYYP